MRSVSKIVFYTFRVFLTLSLVVLVNIPAISFGETNGTTTSPELLSATTTLETTEATTTLVSATPEVESLSEATTTEMIPQELATSTPQEQPATPSETLVEESPEEELLNLQNTPDSVPAISNDESVDSAEEEVVVETVEPGLPTVYNSLRSVQAPSVKTGLSNEVSIDEGAHHYCEAEKFTVDMSQQQSAQVRLALVRDGEGTHELEVGGLPKGFTITVTESGTFDAVQNEEDFLTLSIGKHINSQRGNFSVPIAYTKMRDGASILCQINIINL